MMKRFNRTAILVSTIIAVLSCSRMVPLPPGDWDPDVHAKISATLEDCGRFSAEYDECYIQTFKEGKTGAIKEYIAPSHGGKGPCLVAGDSNGDYNMLTDFDDMKVGLIINCGNKGNIGVLASSGGPKIAVQDRDLSHGKFISCKD